MSNPSHPHSRVIETTILISAPLSTVYTVLLDFASYPSWARFITSIRSSPDASTPCIGDTLQVTISPPNKRPVHLTSTIAHLNENEFGWQGHLFNVRGLFDGRHFFLLSEEEDEGGEKRTRLVQREEFGGMLYVPLMRWLGWDAATRDGFVAFNASIKDRAETLTTLSSHLEHTRPFQGAL